jgi:hypothetical protein
MRVTCLPKDKKVFEDLGFQVQDEKLTACTMEEYEANYAHCDEMPENIPYYGYHAEGGEYGANEFCCDGEALFEAPLHKDGHLVVFWDEKTDSPNEKSVARLKGYLAARERIKKVFSRDPLISAMSQSLLLASHSGSGEQQPTTAGEKGMTDK